MDLSFKEKSIIGSLVITTTVFGWYFHKVFQIISNGSSDSVKGLPVVLLVVVGVIVAVEAIYHAAIALTSRTDDDDERDRLIDGKATRIAYFVLVTGCFLAIGHTTLGVYVEQDTAVKALVNPIVTANLVLMSFILAEIVGFAVQLYYYRQGF